MIVVVMMVVMMMMAKWTSKAKEICKRITPEEFPKHFLRGAELEGVEVVVKVTSCTPPGVVCSVREPICTSLVVVSSAFICAFQKLVQISPKLWQFKLYRPLILLTVSVGPF